MKSLKDGAMKTGSLLTLVLNYDLFSKNVDVFMQEGYEHLHSYSGLKQFLEYMQTILD